MYNYFYIANNQNKLLNKANEKKYHKIGDTLDGLSIKVSGDSNCINVLNGLVRNYVSNILKIQQPQTYTPYLIKDAIELGGFQQVYNHDVIVVGDTKYSLADEFLIVFNTDNNVTTIDFKYIKGIYNASV